jgi:hypothetical protein
LWQPQYYRSSCIGVNVINSMDQLHHGPPSSANMAHP